MKKMRLLMLFLAFGISKTFSQSSLPWEKPLNIAWSNDGITFNSSSVFQDSSGVPSVIKWKGDTLICAFQWFRQPMNSISWDKVAVKFSYDNGVTWTQPSPIVVSNMPVNYQRPFDPTLVKLSDNSIRMYFSSSDGLPQGGQLDSTVNTYSALSTDGINYTFEANPRVDELSTKVIDPAVTFFNNTYHYLCPAGPPQDGAFHYISPDGLNFTKVPTIPSDMQHNWTGNLMLNDDGNMRFYGCGDAGIWFNSTANGGTWDGYTSTNITDGGDPSALEIETGNYLIIYVGTPYVLGLKEATTKNNVLIYPNPAKEYLKLNIDESLLNSAYTVLDPAGKIMLQGNLSSEDVLLKTAGLTQGVYFLKLGGGVYRFIKE